MMVDVERYMNSNPSYGVEVGYSWPNRLSLHFSWVDADNSDHPVKKDALQAREVAGNAKAISTSTYDLRTNS